MSVAITLIGEYRPIAEHPDYFVSSDGEVLALRGDRLKVRKTRPNSMGYLQVDLVDLDAPEPRPRNTRRVHRLVAEAWLGPAPTPQHQVNHKDGCKTNLAVSNLEWTTASKNTKHAYDTGLKQRLAHQEIKLTPDDVRTIRHEYEHGKSYAKLAGQFGVALTTIGSVVRCDTWHWVN